MKKTIILIAAFAIALVAAGQEFASIKNPAPVPVATAFAWTSTSFDFGKIKKDIPVTHEFTFANNGEEPLIISSVQASCGCTVAEYSKDPIPAGGKGFVKATYNAAKTGIFSKTITIKANTDEETVLLTIRGEVTE